jgi:hypothetical protein
MTMVNGRMFQFACRLRELSPITLNDLVRVVGCDFGDAEFQRVIRLLTARGFISLKSDRKEVCHVETV